MSRLRRHNRRRKFVNILFFGFQMEDYFKNKLKSSSKIVISAQGRIKTYEIFSGYLLLQV